MWHGAKTEEKQNYSKNSKSTPLTPIVLTLISQDAFLLHISTGTVSKHVNEYMERTGEVVPTRGIIHDIGRAITHKRIIIRLYEQGYQTPEIARKTNHTEQACDRYIKAYKIVTIKGIKSQMKVGQNWWEKIVNFQRESSFLSYVWQNTIFKSLPFS